MIVELIVNRGWQVLINGVKPGSPWNAPNEEGKFEPPLKVGDVTIGKIVPMRQMGGLIGMEDDWTGEDDYGPLRPAWLIVEVNGDFKNFRITLYPPRVCIKNSATPAALVKFFQNPLKIIRDGKKIQWKVRSIT